MEVHAFVNGTKPTKDMVKIHMIRIVILDYHSPRKIEMQNDSAGQITVTPQRLNQLHIIRQSFRHFMEQYKWKCILEDDGDEDHEDGDNDENNNDNSNVDSNFNSKLNQQRAIKSANTMRCDGDGHARW